MYDVAVLAADRVHLLMKVLSAIEHTFGRDARTHVWIDHNENRPNLHRVVEIARRYADASPEHRRVVTFQRHLGTRAMWLSVLSMAIQRPLVVLEDDVVLRPDAKQWWKFCVDRFEDPRLFACSFTSQTTVATLNSKIGKIRYSTPFLYPLLSSHGFMISPKHARVFVDQLRTRNSSRLYIDSLITTRWFREFERKGLTSERMWTQEAVAYSYHENVTTLFPPSGHSFATHCSHDHASDRLAAKCLKRRGPDAPFQVRPDVALPELSWSAVCIKHCKQNSPRSTPTKRRVRRHETRGA